MNVLKTENLKKYYGSGDGLVKALNGIDFSVEQGEFVAVVGTSGSGKSTLLNMMGGLDNPTEGRIVVDGKEIQKMNADELTVFRRRQIGFVFQNYNLVPMLTVYENITLPIELDGNTVDKDFISNVVKMLHLDDKLDRFPNNLSGGQQQRAAIARAIASKPAISIRDLDLLTIGLVNDMYAENGNDDYKGYNELATQKDFDNF